MEKRSKCSFFHCCSVNSEDFNIIFVNCWNFRIIQCLFCIINAFFHILLPKLNAQSVIIFYTPSECMNLSFAVDKEILVVHVDGNWGNFTSQKWKSGGILLQAVADHHLLDSLITLTLFKQTNTATDLEFLHWYGKCSRIKKNLSARREETDYVF